MEAVAEKLPMIDADGWIGAVPMKAKYFRIQQEEAQRCVISRMNRYGWTHDFPARLKVQPTEWPSRVRLVVAEAEPREHVEAETQDIEGEFRRLVEEWKGRTAIHSSVPRISMDSAYQSIIGMGHDVLPLILREFARRPDHWLWALRHISRQEVAKPGDTFEEARAAWMRWGRERGFLED